MYCQNCAQPLNPAVGFCQYCGQPAPLQAAPAQAFNPAVPYPPSRPSHVTIAASLLFVAVALGVIGIIRTMTMIGVSRYLSLPSLLLTPILLAAWIGLALMTLQGKNWARIGVLIGTIYSAMIIVTTIQVLSRSGYQFVNLILPWIGFLLRVSATGLLFTGDCNDWFRSSSRVGN